LSAASIRNVMADLDEAGYLSQPHTSAGRVPTEKAFQSYAQSLRLRRLASQELARLRAEFRRLDTVEARVEHTSRTLTEMTRSFGIAATIRQVSPALDQIELVALPDSRVLMVVMTRDRQVRNRVVTLEAALTPHELEGIRNYINRNFSGWTLETAGRAAASRERGLRRNPPQAD
jgi:heat-inducible transcriptional repressor